MPDYSIKQVHKDRLYYNQFEYCLLFRQDDAGCLRGLDPRSFKSYLQYRKNWVKPRLRPRSDEEVEANLKNTYAVLTSAPSKIKLVISYDYCYLYHNDLAWAATIEQQCPYISVMEMSQACVTLPKDVVCLLNPTHAYRSYFKEKTLGIDAKARLRDWITAQGTELKLGPGFKFWLYNVPTQQYYHSSRTQRHFYIEHNSAHYQTMLAIISPDLIRKTVPIQQRTK